MRSSYTCQKCLASLRSGTRPQLRRVHQAYPSQQRWISSQGNQPTIIRASPQPALAKRSVSSASRHEQNAASEPFQARILPGLEYTRVHGDQRRLLLQPDNLFHSFSNSPSPDIRRRAAFIKQHAYCPHPDHRQTRLPTTPDDPETKKSPMAGSPPAHVQYECPDCGVALVNMTNWDTFLYSREFAAINEDRSLRQATKLLTYPVTIASVLHELSPYNIRKGGRLTVEGLKSLSGEYYL
jgi:mitochondrial splicing suppressor protein 51